MPKFNIFLYGNSLYTVQAEDEQSAREDMRNWLGVKMLPPGTFVERRTPAHEREMQMIRENNSRNGFSFEYS
jgi:hypothetical protein